MLYDTIILVGILSLGFALRMVFAISEASDDQSVSFWHIRRQAASRWLAYEVGDSLLDGTYPYPVLPHFLISRFPERYWGLTGRIFNSAYDVLTATLVYVVIELLWVDRGSGTRIAGLSPGAVGALLFLTAPVLLPTMSRVVAIKGRPLGLFLTTVYFFALGFAMQLPPLEAAGFYLVCIVVNVLVVMSSMFAIQVVVFFSIPLAVYFVSPVPLALLAASVAVMYLVPSLNCKQILKFSWNHKLYYYQVRDQHTTATRRNRIIDYFNIPWAMFHDIHKLGDLVTRKLSYVAAAYTAPIIFLLPVLILQHGDGLNAILSPMVGTERVFFSEYMWSLVVASVIAFVATSTPWLSIFGQAERYFEYSLPMAVVLLVIILTNLPREVSSMLVWSLFIYQLFASLANLIWLKRPLVIKNESLALPGIKDAVSWFLSEAPQARVVTIPLKDAYKMSTIAASMAGSGHDLRFLYRLIFRDGEKGFKYNVELGGGQLRLPSGYTPSVGVIRLKPAELSRRFGVTHIISEQTRVSDYLAGCDDENGLDLEKEYENSEYAVFRIVPKNHSTQGRRT